MMRCEKTGRTLPIVINEGDKFGLWTVVSYYGKYKSSSNCWNCICECGATGIIPAVRLTSGKSKNCKSGGHLKGVNVRHGMRYTKLYRVWRNMKTRCYKPNAQNYYLYGGRGIKMCDSWFDDFVNFYADMGSGWAEGLHLDRIDVNDHYYKGNCRWVTPLVNSRNKRNTAYLTYKGVTKRAREWAEMIGANPRSVVRRIYLGWTPEECLFGKFYEQIKKLIMADSILETTLHSPNLTNNTSKALKPAKSVKPTLIYFSYPDLSVIPRKNA